MYMLLFFFFSYWVQNSLVDGWVIDGWMETPPVTLILINSLYSTKNNEILTLYESMGNTKMYLVMVTMLTGTYRTNSANKRT